MSEPDRLWLPKMSPNAATGSGFVRCADQGEVAVAAEELEVRVEVVLGGDGVEDEIEAAGVLPHLVGVAGDDDLVGSEPERVVLLLGRGREHDHVSAERPAELHTHVAEAAEADHADILALRDPLPAHRRVGRDPGAEERRRSREVEVRWDAQDEALVDHDALGIAAVGDAAEVLVRRVVREDRAPAELLVPGLALGAGPVGVDEASDADVVAGPELRDRRADRRDPPDDLVTRDARVRGRHAAPLVARGVEVGVADAAEEDLDEDILRGRVAPPDRGGGERGGRAGDRVSFRVVHGAQATLARARPEPS